MRQLQTREKITIGVGAAIVLAVLVWRLAGMASASPAGGGDTIAGSIGQIMELDSLHQSVAADATALHVKIPAVPPIEQTVALREDLTRLVQQAGVQLTSVQGVEGSSAPAPGVSSGTAPATVRPVQLRLELTGPFDGFMRLINGLEQSEIPYAVREVHFDSATPSGGRGGGPSPGGPAGRGGGGGGAGQPGSVRVSMKLQSYIFPEVIAAKPAPASAAEGRAGTADAGAPGRRGRAAGAAGSGVHVTTNTQSGREASGAANAERGRRGATPPEGLGRGPGPAAPGRARGTPGATGGWQARGTPNAAGEFPNGGADQSRSAAQNSTGAGAGMNTADTPVGAPPATAITTGREPLSEEPHS